MTRTLSQSFKVAYLQLKNGKNYKNPNDCTLFYSVNQYLPFPTLIIKSCSISLFITTISYHFPWDLDLTLTYTCSTWSLSNLQSNCRYRQTNTLCIAYILIHVSTRSVLLQTNFPYSFFQNYEFKTRISIEVALHHSFKNQTVHHIKALRNAYIMKL